MVGASALALSAPSDACPNPTRGDPLPRNVLLVDLDDLGRELLDRALAFGGAPNMASMVATGRSWGTFWAAPNCSLFRARVLSGADAYRPESYVGRLVGTSDPFPGPAGPWLPVGLLGRKVKVGKWHLSGTVPAALFPFALVANGWDRFVGSHSNLFTGGAGYYNWKEYDADQSGWSSNQQAQHNTTRLAQLALAELAAGTELVHVSFCAVHLPLELPPNDEPPGKVYQGSTDSAIRAAMLFHLDHWLGVLVQDAVARGYVVLVACDNGTNQAGKNTYKEAGNNTPLFACGDGVVPGMSGRLIAATDLWATVRRLRGDSVSTAPDSVDFCDDLLGWPAIHQPREFLTLDWYPALGVPPVASQWSRMIRDARWKYVDQKMGPAGTTADAVVALHDLESDPDEVVNLLDAPLAGEARAALALLLANLPQ